MAKTPIQKAIASLSHDDTRLNVPTAEMASLFEQQAELTGDVEREMVLPRPRPLAQGETRARDGDLDPQIVWNGVKIRITKAQMRQLAEREAMRGKGSASISTRPTASSSTRTGRSPPSPAT